MEVWNAVLVLVSVLEASLGLDVVQDLLQLLVFKPSLQTENTREHFWSPAAPEGKSLLLAAKCSTLFTSSSLTESVCCTAGCVH